MAEQTADDINGPHQHDVSGRGIKKSANAMEFFCFGKQSSQIVFRWDSGYGNHFRYRGKSLQFSFGYFRMWSIQRKVANDGTSEQTVQAGMDLIADIIFLCIGVNLHWHTASWEYLPSTDLQIEQMR